MDQIKKLLDKLSYISAVRAKVMQLQTQVLEQGTFAAGHYYSPVPFRGYVAQEVKQGHRPGELTDIDFRREAQLQLLRSFCQYYGELPFQRATRRAMSILL